MILLNNNVVFQVSAKTARLIGRENISDVDGAILELVKNSYDADADCVYVRYLVPYVRVPSKLSLNEIETFLGGKQETITQYYDIKEGIYTLKEGLKQDKLASLKLLLSSISKIVILDNGSGMTRKILETTWMNIGTDDKEVNIVSPVKERIKTGAKGIGRFALDKLSLKSKIVTKNVDDKLMKWDIDWRQFDDAKLLNQVEANIDSEEGTFVEIVKQLSAEDFDILKKYDWSSGTAIVLEPVRDFWQEKSFIKVNQNLKNINPLGNVDKFDVFVKNVFFSQLNYESKSNGISRDSYDYMIDAEYDGKNTVTINLDRNELDISVGKVEISYSDTDKEVYDLEEFWRDEFFQKDKYRKEDFNGKVEFKYALSEIIPKEKSMELSNYESIGPFHMKVYYLKQNKSVVEIIRDFRVRERQKMLKNFSGIKIYRDNFKVRPYGDEGILEDWINLGKRVQSSPAAASHDTGNWRVSPNQVIGSISISRITNPKLDDTANREGMNLNAEYSSFVKLIQGIFTKFEYDRQLPLREYALWRKSKTSAHEVKVQEIYEAVLKERDREQKGIQDSKDNALNEETRVKREYSEKDLKDVIYSLGHKERETLATNQLLLLLSSAGVMTQTFAHEISRIATGLGSRGQHLEAAMDIVLEKKPYTGDKDFNPYTLIDELNSTDVLLSEWVNLIMDSIEEENFYVQEVSIQDFLTDIKEKWESLLARKHIKIAEIECPSNLNLSMPLVDLHLLVSNFLLNSAYFLEDSDEERIIDFKVYKKDQKVCLDLKNNGPELDERYKQNPDIILEPRVSSKNGGTGLGLWVARDAVNRNDGNLHVILIEHGFMLRASWRR